MLALLGCTYDDIRGVLTALGYVSTIEEPKAAEPKEDAPATAEEQAAPASDEADKPTETTTAEAANTDTPTSEPTESADAPKAPTPPQRSEPKALNVFHYKETAEDGTAISKENLEYWEMPLGNRNRQNRPHRGHFQNLPARSSRTGVWESRTRP